MGYRRKAEQSLQIPGNPCMERKTASLLDVVISSLAIEPNLIRKHKVNKAKTTKARMHVLINMFFHFSPASSYPPIDFIKSSRQKNKGASQTGRCRAEQSGPSMLSQGGKKERRKEKNKEQKKNITSPQINSSSPFPLAAALNPPSRRRQASKKIIHQTPEPWLAPPMLRRKNNKAFISPHSLRGIKAHLLAKKSPPPPTPSIHP